MRVCDEARCVWCVSVDESDDDECDEGSARLGPARCCQRLS